MDTLRGSGVGRRGTCHERHAYRAGIAERDDRGTRGNGGKAFLDMIPVPFSLPAEGPGLATACLTGDHPAAGCDPPRTDRMLAPGGARAAAANIARRRRSPYRTAR